MPITTAAVLGGIQTAAGIGQYLSGRAKAKKNIRPEYQIPQEIAQNLTQAQMQALEGLPPEQKKQYVENVQRQQNFGLTALADRKAGISGLAALTQGGTDAYKNLLTADAQARQENLDKLTAQREITAGYKDKAFEINKLTPYQEKAEAAAALQGAGMQNVFGGLSSMQGTFENKALADAMKEGGVQAGAAPSTTPFGTSSATERMGGLNTLGNRSEAQQFLLAQQNGFTGTFNEWKMKNKSNVGLGFANMIK